MPARSQVLQCAGNPLEVSITDNMRFQRVESVRQPGVMLFGVHFHGGVQQHPLVDGRRAPACPVVVDTQLLEFSSPDWAHIEICKQSIRLEAPASDSAS